MDGSSWRPPQGWGEPLLVTGPDARGGRLNGTRRKWDSLTPGERRRLVAPGGGWCLIAVRGDGWFTDPSRALCLKLAGTPAAGKPLAGMCDSARCPQATHHPCHRPVWADAADQAKAFLGSLGPTRKTGKACLQADYDRATRVLAAIDATAGEHGARQ